MMTVTELARQSGVTPDTVRHYTSKGLLQPERNPRNGYRLFCRDDVQRIEFIRRAQVLGFTLSEIKKILDEARRGVAPCPLVRQIIAERITENRDKIRQLIALQGRMEDALNRWQVMPDCPPDGSSICCLIEAIETEA